MNKKVIVTTLSYEDNHIDINRVLKDISNQSKIVMKNTYLEDEDEPDKETLYLALNTRYTRPVRCITLTNDKEVEVYNLRYSK